MFWGVTLKIIASIGVFLAGGDPSTSQYLCPSQQLPAGMGIPHVGGTIKFGPSEAGLDRKKFSAKRRKLFKGGSKNGPIWRFWGVFKFSPQISMKNANPAGVKLFCMFLGYLPSPAASGWQPPPPGPPWGSSRTFFQPTHGNPPRGP